MIATTTHWVRTKLVPIRNMARIVFRCQHYRDIPLLAMLQASRSLAACEPARKRPAGKAGQSVQEAQSERSLVFPRGAPAQSKGNSLAVIFALDGELLV